ncbi:MAG: hypothetical protein LBE62_14975 [Azonexus sp.]|jgi:hypothetical protein|nr:hypothetical protein [Azonexus sp.]
MTALIDERRSTPAWMPLALRAAAIYNLCCALALSLWPTPIFQWLAMPATPAAMIQCIGMMVGVYALAYWIAARDLRRYWPLIVVGLLGKTLGPLGFLYHALTGALAWRSGLLVLGNDLIWWLPFWGMMAYAFRHRHEWRA